MSTLETPPGGAPAATSLRLSRREFFRLFGAGIVVGVTVQGWSPAAAQEGRRMYPADFNAYLRIGPDGRVTVFSGKIEMGQGVITSLAQMAAEELGVALDRIDMVMGDTRVCVPDAGTWGSMSTRFFGPALRAAAAEARAVLTELAAEALQAPVAQLVVDNGVVRSRSGRRVTFGELAKGRAIQRHVRGTPALRERAAFTVSGTSVRRTDGRAKVTGAAVYAGDVRLPGMLYARVVQPPAHGATLKRIDASAAAALPGVVVYGRDGLNAVLAPDPERAEAALARVQAEWDVPAPEYDHDTVFDHLLATAPAPQEMEQKGDLDAGARAATRTFEHRYENGYGAHAPMEPHTALARAEDGGVTLWISTQAPFSNRGQIAHELQLAPEQVRVITPFVGGGFGGKAGTPIQAIHAAKLAIALGKPVQVAWTRAEEFFHDAFRPAGVALIRSGMDAAGKLTLWDAGCHGMGGRGAEQCYDVPNHRVRLFGSWYGGGGAGGQHLFAVGPWRAPGANLNVFARESHLDDMAAAARIDPLQFRLDNLADRRMRAVLTAVAERFGWSAAVAPSGRGVGIACGIDAGSYVAMCAEVAVDRSSGRVRVQRIACAQDMGQVINPDGAKMQVEGCIAMGLGYALSEELRFRGGEVLERNFDTYRLPRFSDMPQVEVVIVPNDDVPPQGGGEPAIITVGAAIANAIHDAVGVRVRRMPMTAALVRAGITG